MGLNVPMSVLIRSTISAHDWGQAATHALVLEEMRSPYGIQGTWRWSSSLTSPESDLTQFVAQQSRYGASSS